MQANRFLMALFIGCFMFFCLSSELQAQTGQKEDVAGLIESSLESETLAWSPDKPILVTVRLKNIGDRTVNISGIYTLELTPIDDPSAAKRSLPQTACYWSPINILTGTPLKLEQEQGNGGKVPEVAIDLAPGEIKVMKFELTKLLWNQTFSSIWPHQQLFEVVAKGNYDLFFDIETTRRTNSGNDPIVTHVASNKVRILIE